MTNAVSIPSRWIIIVPPSRSLADVIANFARRDLPIEDTGKTVALRDANDRYVAHVVRAQTDLAAQAVARGAKDDEFAALCREIYARRVMPDGTLGDPIEMPRVESAKRFLPPQIASWAALIFKLLKTAKALKAALAAASVGAYAWLFTWEFSLALVAGLVIHEMGHVWAMRRCGVPTKGFYLIPFVGGIAFPEESFKARSDEVYIAAMGPTWGIASIVLIAPVMYWYGGLAMAAGVASFLAYLNLINLLPITPLDGGRIVKSAALSVRHWSARVLLILAIAASAVILWNFGAIAFSILVALSFLDLRYEHKRQDAVAPMGFARIGGALGWWILLGASFATVMVSASYVPGVDIAMTLLRGG